MGIARSVPQVIFWFKNGKKRYIFTQIRALTAQIMISKQKNPNLEPNFWKNMQKLKKFKIFLEKSRKNFTSRKLEKIGRSSRSTPSDFLV